MINDTYRDMRQNIDNEWTTSGQRVDNEWTMSGQRVDNDEGLRKAFCLIKV